MNTYVFVAFLSVFAISIQGLTDEQNLQIQEHFKECLMSTGADPEVVRHLKDGKFVEDSRLSEFMFCFFQKVGFMDREGNLQLKTIKTKLVSEFKLDDLDKLIEKCDKVVGKDLPDKALKVFKCYYDNTPSHIILAI